MMHIIVNFNQRYSAFYLSLQNFVMLKARCWRVSAITDSVYQMVLFSVKSDRNEITALRRMYLSKKRKYVCLCKF